jgi:HPt (histidine-containing phosphotransfer) domain-containing protein
MADSANTPEAVQRLLAGLRIAFIAELPERVQAIEELVLACRHSGREEAFDALFRAVHSLKGSGGTHGLAALSTVCHQFEDVIKEGHARLARLDNTVINPWLEYVDLLRQLAAQARAGSTDFKELLASLDVLTRTVVRERQRGLLVSSSPSLMAIWQRALDGLPVSLVTESDGLAALERLLRERFDFLVTGNTLQSLNGVALLAALRSSDSASRHLPAVLVATNASVAMPVGLKFEHVIVRDASMPDRLYATVQRFCQPVTH